MVLHAEHPVNMYKEYELAYLDLLRTYIDFEVPYWLDAPFSQGRMRFTHQFTGEYVIYGDPGKYADPLLDMGIDEDLHMNVPEGLLRARDVDGTFTLLKVPEDVKYKSVLQYYVVTVTSVRGAVHFSTQRLGIYDLRTTREIQYKKILNSTYNARLLI